MGPADQALTIIFYPSSHVQQSSQIVTIVSLLSKRRLTVRAEIRLRINIFSQKMDLLLGKLYYTGMCYLSALAVVHCLVHTSIVRKVP